MLAARMTAQGSKCWLINTGWVGGAFGQGKRCPLKYTRKIVDAVHDGSLAQANFTKTGVFGLAIPDKVSGVPDELLNPAWSDKKAFDAQNVKLAGASLLPSFPPPSSSPLFFSAFSSSSYSRSSLYRSLTPYISRSDMFTAAFSRYSSEVTPEVLAAGPKY